MKRWYFFGYAPDREFANDVVENAKSEYPNFEFKIKSYSNPKDKFAEVRKFIILHRRKS